jgi:hypothetical protein
VWANTNGAGTSAVFEDLGSKDAADQHLFVGGIFWGLAGAAFIALWPEGAEFVRVLRGRHEARKHKGSAKVAASTDAANSEPTVLEVQDRSAVEPVQLAGTGNADLEALHPTTPRIEDPGSSIVPATVVAGAVGAAVGALIAKWDATRRRR